MLHEFITSNRGELIDRRHEKVAKRFEPSIPPALINNGVPLFLKQLSSTLAAEQQNSNREAFSPEPTPVNTDIGRAAALHGAEMLRLGHSIDQVVHEYGDVCQSVTDMAVQKDFLISTDEFRTLNRCLDNAIADAVASYSESRRLTMATAGEGAALDLEQFLGENERLVEASLHAFGAIRTGNVGLRGPTGDLLLRLLDDMRSLLQRIHGSPNPRKSRRQEV